MHCFGGLQIFVDLEKADSVNRAKLFTKLSDLPIDDNIICLLHCWHVDTDYFVTHGGESVAVPVTRGLRQGCKGAPYLWNCLMVLMLRQLQTLVTYRWIRDHVTIYADDIHVGGTFRNVQEFEALIAGISALFMTLKDFDLRINPQKSTALLTMHGHQGRKLRARHVQKEGNAEILKISSWPP